MGAQGGTSNNVLTDDSVTSSQSPLDSNAEALGCPFKPVEREASDHQLGTPVKRTKTSGATLSSERESHASSMEALSGNDFGFPYPHPYPSQLQLMRAVYQTIEQGAIGVFESPTGTGKSLSLICAALTWVRQARARSVSSVAGHTAEEDEPAWLRDSGCCTNSPTSPDVNALRHRLNDAGSPRSGSSALIRRPNGPRDMSPYPGFRRSLSSLSQKRSLPNLDTPMDFILLDGDDEELGNDDSLSSARRSHSGFRVLYCSRTHSQLSQFIGEVRRTPFVEQKPPVATTVLASRKQMCIHPEVRRLRSATAVNDRCHELRTKKVTLPSGVQQVACPFYDEERIHHLTEVMHDRVCDLEDLMELGQRHRACPYYAARASFQAAELVLMPYQTLLHETTRKSAKVGIDERTIVIIDEAHNLVDALNDMYSVRVSLCEIRAMQTSLESFICNQKRWKPDPQRSYCLEQLRRLLDALEGAIDPPPRKMNNVVATTRSQGIVIDPVANAFGRTQGMESDSTDPDDGASHELCQSPSDFVFQLEIENMNFAAILTYLFQSRCIYMLQSAHESQRREGEWMQAPNDASSAAGLEANIADRAMLQSSAGSFFDLVALLKVLSEPGAEGRVLTAPKRHVRYLLLDPATYFSPIYRQARATILAGGTLEPREALLPRLFDQAHCKKLSFRSFPHVVPPEHTLALFVGQGPRSIAFDFSYAHRHGVEQINELGRLLLNVCAVVPAGLVVFFPSYAFEDSVWKHFHESGVAASLGKRKKVFRERRHGDTEALLEDFRQAVQGTSTAASAGPAGPRGALLSAVIGGRLSEGINFADDLGRCVVVVGLPFPNAWQTETRLQVQFLRERQRQLSQHSDSGGEFIENVCMIAVNQTVGRVIRHAGDYAAILFVDQRYEQQPRLRRKLSCWLRDRVQIPPSFGHAFQLLAQFFRERRSRSP